MLRQEIVLQIKKEALNYLGNKYDHTHFNCMTFVRSVYEKVGLKLPPLYLNVTYSSLNNNAEGFIIYLKRKGLNNTKRFTHAGIILDRLTCIHCSYYSGGMVVLTGMKELLKDYDIAGN